MEASNDLLKETDINVGRGWTRAIDLQLGDKASLHFSTEMAKHSSCFADTSTAPFAVF